MNIILDMDGTLINDKMEPRPHLKDFFRYIFEKFNHVSIWTLASVQWYTMAYERVFKPLLPLGKSFHFVWCRVNYKVSQPSILGGIFSMNLASTGTGIIKPLTEVYKRFPIVYNPYNTLIVDDTPFTYSENPGNAIKVSTFGNNMGDRELPDIIYRLRGIFP